MNKKFKEILVIFFLTCLMISGKALLAQSRKSLAVLPFDGLDDCYIAKRALYDMLIEVLIKEKKFNIVERADIENIIEEQKLGQSGFINKDYTCQVGRLLGADCLLLGTITCVRIFIERSIPTQQGFYNLYQAEIGIQIKVIETETGLILGSILKSAYSHRQGCGEYCPSNDLIILAARNLVRNYLYYDILNLFPSDGYIIQINSWKEDKVRAVIDLGREMGVRIGNKFLIFRRGQSIQHPVTGASIPGKLTKIGEGKVVELDDYTATIEMKSNLYAQVGDLVRSKEKKRSFLDEILTGY